MNVMHTDLCLSGDYLRKGMHVTGRTASKLPCIYAMMAEKFVPNKPLDVPYPGIVKDIDKMNRSYLLVAFNK